MNKGLLQQIGGVVVTVSGVAAGIFFLKKGFQASKAIAK